VTELRSLVTRGIPRRTVNPLRSRLAVASALFIGMSGSAIGGAVAAGVTLPEPLRVVASGIGLPVDSVGLAQAKTDADRLRRDLDRSDAHHVPRDAAALQDTFSGLSADDRRRIDREVDSLLDRAATYDGRDAEGPGEASGPGGTSASGDSDGSGSQTSPTTTVPGAQSSGSGDGGSVSGGGDGGGGDTSATTATTAPTSDSGATSSSPTTSGSGGGGGDGGGTDGGSVTGSDGGG
jgi:hypothetical protein